MTPTKTVNEHERSFSALRETTRQWVDLSDDEWSMFRSIFSVRTFERNEHILTPGSRKYRLFFVARGLLRVYSIDEDGRESNKGFIAEGTLAGPLAAYMLDMPSLSGAECLEPATLLVTRYPDLLALYDKKRVFERLGRKYAEWTVVQKELRERISYQTTAAERYAAFEKYYPDFALRVPQYHVASLIGITPESLSRLRATARAPD